VNFGCLGQRPEVAGVGGEDLVSVIGQADDRGVDRITLAGPTQEHARASAQPVVERSDVDPAEQACHVRLSAAATPPHLCDHAPMRQGGPTSEALAFHQSDQIAVAPLDRDEGTSIQHQSHVAARF
jgi:hypothetical protein